MFHSEFVFLFKVVIVMRFIVFSVVHWRIRQDGDHPGHVTRSHDWECPMVLFISIFLLNSKLSSFSGGKCICEISQFTS